jgi:NitT/TauT family transport system permease protein
MILFGYRVPMMASLVLWALVWEAVGQLDLVLMFPPLSAVLAALVELVPTPTFLDAAWITLRSFVLGMLLAIAVGVPMGILMGRVEAADRLLGMWVNLFVSAPLTALVPVIMILFGMGETTVIVTVFLFAVWIIALDARAGARGIPASLAEMARSFGASRAQFYWKIVLLAALPEILAGIRLGLIRGVKGVVIGQLLVAVIGIGALFELYSRNFLMALILAELIERVERRVEYYAGVRNS